ncbi:signal peptidase II [Nocardioides sp. ChNu-153]|uniref:signal peptidase II n=1 Tax=unclassified Nocardioides TaxID=2615069 RepID=UPI002405D846|nr:MULTISPECIES: signal peptidase II [unclassified Nocardioides]MDF9716567.1 signal peptidase II [Nocardioides sp. ChNu-99]MDN7120908.1 signal peptidase II [Nocardioides sp. ChNu-153]
MQAARGASLSHGSGDPDRPPSSPASRRRRTWTAFLLVALAAYAVDLTTKELALRHLADGPVALVDDLLVLRLVFNPGAAFSLGTGATPVLTVVAIVATIAVLVASRRLGSALWAVALGLLLAGVTGNLTDRLLRDPGPFHGHVVDMIALPSWPVFNVADMCINVAAALIVVQAFRGVRVDGGRVDDDRADSTPEADQPAGEDPR